MSSFIIFEYFNSSIVIPILCIHKYSENGALIQRKFYKNGNLDGPLKNYFVSGEPSVEYEVEFKDNLAQGRAVTYYPDGTIFAEYNYTDDKRNGKENQYHEDGSPYSEGTLRDNAYFGPFKVYHPNGKLKQEGHIRSV